MTLPLAPIPARKPRTKRKRAQGKSLLEALQAAGINASNVKRNRLTHVHTIEFVDPNLTDLKSTGTASAKTWARRITAAFSDIEIVDTYDTIADHRPNKPVLFAQVFVRIKSGQKKSA